MAKLTLHLGVAAAAVLMLTACGSPGSTPSPTRADQLDVVVAFYPLQFAAERVGGDGVTVTNLTQPGAEAHDVELTPRQVAALSQADVVIYQKGFQPAVDSAVAQAKPRYVLEVGTVVDMHPMTESGGHAHDTTPGASNQNADHTAPDPHVWLDPTKMITITDTVADTLSRASAERAPSFRTNAAALDQELKQLDESFRTGLQTCRRREFVVSHAAFGYIADRYGLVQIPIRGLSPDVEPSPTRIAEVQKLAREHGVTTIFYETLVSPAVAKSVAGDLGLKTAVLDPLEGLTEASRGQNYLDVMKSNLISLKAANECQ